MGSIIPHTLNGQRYATAYRSRHLGDILYDASFALAQDPSIPEKMLREPKIRQAVEDTTLAVAMSSWTVKPFSKRADDVAWAGYQEQIATCCRGLSRILRLLARYYFSGEEYAQPNWRMLVEQLEGDVAPRRIAVVESMQHIDRRRFRRRVFREPGGLRPVVDWEMATVWDQASATGDGWVRLDGREGRRRFDDFVRVASLEPEGMFGRGDGLINAVYWFYYAKQIVMREGLQGLERWAQGWVIFKQDAEAEGAVDDDSETVIEDAIEEIETHTGRRILGIDKRDEIQVEAGPQNSEMIEFWTSYLDNGIMGLLTGSVLPQGGGQDVGSNARARVEQDVNDRFVQAKQIDLAEDLTSGFLLPLHEANASARHAMGLGSARCGSFMFTQDVVEDPTRNTQNAVALLGAGVALVEEDLYDKTNFKQPKEGDKIVQFQRPDPTAFGPFGGGQ